MIRRMVVGLALVAGVIVAFAALPVRAEDTKQPPDLTGMWRLDPARSDQPRGPEGGSAMRGPGGRAGRGGFGGRGGAGPTGGPGGGDAGWGGRGGGGPQGEMGRSPRGEGPGGERGGGDEGRTAARPVRLPDLMHVTQTGTIVSFEDSTGKVIQEITTLTGGKDTLAHAPGAQVASGVWRDAGLVVERQSPRGGRITQVVTLEDKGNLLVVRVKIDMGGDMPAREMKRAYRRAVEE